MLKQLRLAFGSYFVAHRFIMKHRLLWYALIPMILQLIFLGIIIFTASELNEYISLKLQSYFEEKNNWFIATEVLIKAISYLAFLLVYYYIYRALLLSVLSPFLAYISEKVDSLYTGRDFPFSWKQFLLDVWRGIILSLRNLLIEMSLVFILILLGLIPILGWITPLIIISVQSFFLGYMFIDYTNERKKWNLKERRNYVKQNRPLTIGIGLVFNLLFIIPIIGGIVAPLYGVVAGTLSVLQNDNIKAPYLEETNS
ncbi:MAG: EI24 domain-containing protein [Flavobacteriales bacterium]|jgi:CysZ protein|nr:EI24 domain-containing protein [Flavobacteriales bacterium]